MDELRIKLFEITNNGRPETHIELIRQLGDRIPHTVEVRDGPAIIERYTCVMHAFNLIENQEYADIIRAAPQYVFASTDFLQRIIVREELLQREQPEAGGLVVYLSNHCAKHIGRMITPDRVESKWGIGHLYQHGIWEVPAQYGSEVKYFESLDTEDALDAFVEYAKQHGVAFEGDA